MPLPKCRWCASGVPWNDCRCEAALFAQRHGYAAALKKFEAAIPYLLPVKLRPGAGAEPDASGSLALTDGGREPTEAHLPSARESSHSFAAGTPDAKGRTAGSIPATGANSSVDVSPAIDRQTQGRTTQPAQAAEGSGPAGERPAHSHVAGGTIAPPGVCPWCDRRREKNANAARERRAKQKADPG